MYSMRTPHPHVHGTKVVEGLEEVSCEEQLGELGVFGLAGGGLRGYMMAMFKYMRGCRVEEGTGLFSLAFETRTQSNGF